MTELNKRVEKVLNGYVFDVYTDIYVPVTAATSESLATFEIVDPQGVADSLNIVKPLNNFNNKYKDDEKLALKAGSYVREAIENWKGTTPVLGLI